MILALDIPMLADFEIGNWIEVVVAILVIGGSALSGIVNEYTKRAKAKKEREAGGDSVKPPPRAEAQYPKARPMQPPSPPPVPPRPRAESTQSTPKPPVWRPNAPGPVAPGYEDWRPKPSPKSFQPAPAPKSDWRPQPTKGPIPPPKQKSRKRSKSRQQTLPPADRSEWQLKPTDVPDPHGRPKSGGGRKAKPRRATSADPTAPAEPLELHHLEISDNLRVTDEGAVSGLPAVHKPLREDLGLESRSALRRAVLLQEILGTPVGLRDWE